MIVIIDWQFRTLIINRLNNLDEVVAYTQRMPQESFFSYNLFFVRCPAPARRRGQDFSVMLPLMFPCC